MNQEKTTGWGAYQNKKKEIEKLKKQIVVQDLNNYGDVISIDKNNNFKHESKPINPFRFPNKIKNEEIIELVIKDDYKTEISEEVSKEILKEEDVSEEENNVDEVLKEEVLEEQVLEEEVISKEINNYKLKISKNAIMINNLIKENQNNKKELEDKINELTKEYETKLTSNNNKINKLQKYNNTIEDLIKIKINLLEIEKDIISNNDNSKIETSIINDDIKSDDKDDNDDEDDETFTNNCEIEQVPDERSIINIMKNAYNKQQETNTSNFIPDEIKSYNGSVLIIDDVKYTIIKQQRWKSYLTYKTINNKSNYNQTSKKCCYCGRKLRWSVINSKWVDIHCEFCDKIVIDFRSIMTYNNKIFIPDKIIWSKQLNFDTRLKNDTNHFLNTQHAFYATSFDFNITEQLSIRIEKKNEEIYLNDTREYIYWLYVKDNYIYVRGDYFKNISNNKYISPFKETPTIKYKDVSLEVEKEVTSNYTLYRAKINGIYLII